MDFGAFIVEGFLILISVCLVVVLLFARIGKFKYWPLIGLLTIASLGMTILGGAFIYKVFMLDEALVVAVSSNDLPKAKELLDRGANPNAEWESGESALEFARENKNAEMERMLIAAGARE